MLNIKKDFPIFKNNPNLVYLDNGATVQKPQIVVDGVNSFVSNYYSNIHRGQFELAENSEQIYNYSKKLVGEILNCDQQEVIYTYNSTYGFNLIAQSLVFSKKLKKGDKVLLGIREHHANVITWMNLSKLFGFKIEFINIKEDFDIDIEDFKKKYDSKTKVVSLSHTSNVTGKIYNIKMIKSLLKDETFFIVDGSQYIPHFPVDVEELGVDAYIFTGHKMMAYTGIGVCYMKKELIKSMDSLISGGGAIEDVSQTQVKFPTTLEKFEPGTPNLTGAVSLLKAIEYIKSIGYDVIQNHEKIMNDYIGSRFEEFKDEVELIGPSESRIGVYSFLIKNESNQNLIGEHFANNNICIRCGGHCAYPLHKYLKIGGTCRVSTYIYNDTQDIDKFFESLKTFLQKYK